MLGVLVPDLLARLGEEWAEHRRRWVVPVLPGGELLVVFGVLLGRLREGVTAGLVQVGLMHGSLSTVLGT